MRIRAYLRRPAASRTMRCAPLLLLLVAVTGCGAAATAVPVTVKAPPQTAALDWQEPYPADTPALVFGVSSFTVTSGGWSAAVSVENRSTVGWKVGGALGSAGYAFGAMLFPNDDLNELDRLNRSGNLPGIRPATSYVPRLPAVLAPHTTWRGTISAPGPLAGGLWVRLSFGAFTSVGTPPTGTQNPVIWFTDHAHQLEQATGDPA
jgi:hypothetical protein